MTNFQEILIRIHDKVEYRKLLEPTHYMDIGKLAYALEGRDEPTSEFKTFTTGIKYISALLGIEATCALLIMTMMFGLYFKIESMFSEHQEKKRKERHRTQAIANYEDADELEPLPFGAGGPIPQVYPVMMYHDFVYRVVYKSILTHTIVGYTIISAKDKPLVEENKTVDIDLPNHVPESIIQHSKLTPVRDSYGKHLISLYSNEDVFLGYGSRIVYNDCNYIVTAEHVAYVARKAVGVKSNKTFILPVYLFIKGIDIAVYPVTENEMSVFGFGKIKTATLKDKINYKIVSKTEGVTYVSHGVVQRSKGLPFFTFQHYISSVPGYSGSPILDRGEKCVAIHTHGAKNNKDNLGVALLPVLSILLGKQIVSTNPLDQDYVVESSTDYTEDMYRDKEMRAQFEEEDRLNAIELEEQFISKNVRRAITAFDSEGKFLSRKDIYMSRGDYYVRDYVQDFPEGTEILETNYDSSDDENERRNQQMDEDYNDRYNREVNKAKTTIKVLHKYNIESPLLVKQDEIVKVETPIIKQPEGTPSIEMEVRPDTDIKKADFCEALETERKLSLNMYKKIYVLENQLKQYGTTNSRIQILLEQLILNQPAVILPKDSKSKKRRTRRTQNLKDLRSQERKITPELVQVLPKLSVSCTNPDLIRNSQKRETSSGRGDPDLQTILPKKILNRLSTRKSVTVKELPVPVSHIV
jgi:hypothetical protein